MIGLSATAVSNQSRVGRTRRDSRPGAVICSTRRSHQAHPAVTLGGLCSLCGRCRSVGQFGRPNSSHSVPVHLIAFLNFSRAGESQARLQPGPAGTGWFAGRSTSTRPTRVRSAALRLGFTPVIHPNPKPSENSRNAVRFANGLLTVEDRSHRGGGLFLHRRQDVRVRVERDFHAGMAQSSRHDVHRFAGLEQESRAGVAHAVNVIAFTFAAFTSMANCRWPMSRYVVRLHIFSAARPCDGWSWCKADAWRCLV